MAAVNQQVPIESTWYNGGATGCNWCLPCGCRYMRPCCLGVGQASKEVQLTDNTGNQVWAALYVAAVDLNVPKIEELTSAQPSVADLAVIMALRYEVSHSKQQCGRRECMLCPGMTCQCNGYDCPAGVCCGECPPCVYVPPHIWTAKKAEGSPDAGVIVQTLGEMIQAARATANTEENYTSNGKTTPAAAAVLLPIGSINNEVLL
eukprot:gene538-23477_t